MTLPINFERRDKNNPTFFHSYYNNHAMIKLSSTDYPIKQILWAGFLLLMVALACGQTTTALTPSPVPLVVEPTRKPISAIVPATQVEDLLMNGAYHLPDAPGQAIQLENGHFEQVQDSAQGVRMIAHYLQYSGGDLNNDGVEDAVVLLVAEFGGSGSFVYLAAMINQGGNYENAATVLLGDRAVVNKLGIADGKISVEMLTQGPQDPMCCPSQKVNPVYRLTDGQLISNQ